MHLRSTSFANPDLQKITEALPIPVVSDELPELLDKSQHLLVTDLGLLLYICSLVMITQSSNIPYDLTARKIELESFLDAQLVKLDEVEAMNPDSVLYQTCHQRLSNNATLSEHLRFIISSIKTAIYFWRPLAGLTDAEFCKSWATVLINRAKIRVMTCKETDGIMVIQRCSQELARTNAYVHDFVECFINEPFNPATMGHASRFSERARLGNAKRFMKSKSVMFPAKGKRSGDEILPATGKRSSGDSVIETPASAAKPSI